MRFDDSAASSIRTESGNATGSYKPANPLRALKGRYASGKWRLLIEKPSTNDDGGGITCFKAQIRTRR